ncbi:PREDICTED: pygopus homolog 2, partial [Aptenodytes forsteri]|uniref:pygopus homolog 2 n=1 Tax=Aptenodytes forsteri TaxID=9233 RepID=UPI000904FCA1
VAPGYGGVPLPLRRQPPPFAPGQMGPAFGVPPQNPNYVQPGGMGFPGQPFGQPLGQNFSPPTGQLMQGPVGGFGPIPPPTMGQPPRGDVGPGPALNPPGGPPRGKAAGGSGHQPPPGLVYPCGACRNEVNDDQDAILCEASCQKWFHRECTGMTENAYGLLTTEASAVWACDFCLKTKEIQSVYVREGMGQLVAANDG